MSLIERSHLFFRQIPDKSFEFPIFIRNFANRYYNSMGMTTKKITREEALKRWNAAKATKKAMVEKMQKALFEEYKARTGEEPLQFNVW